MLICFLLLIFATALTAAAAADTTAALTLTIATPSATAGQVAFTFTCSAGGSVYYVLGLGQSASSFEKAQIKTQTQDSGKETTPYNESDSNWVVHGYKLLSAAAPFTAQATITSVKAGANYTVFAYCQSIFKTSDKGNQTWIQTTNGGKMAKLSLKFKTALTAAQKKEFAGALALVLKISLKRVLTEDGIPAGRRDLQVNNTTNNTTVPVVPNISVSFYVLPDYSAPADTTFTSLGALVTAGTIWTQVQAKIPAASLASYPAYEVGSATNAENVIPSVVPSFVGDPTAAATNITLSITVAVKDTCFVYAGLASGTAATPTLPQLKNFTDGSNAALMPNYRKQRLLNNSTVPDTVWAFSSLTQNTTYRFFFVAVADDPSPSAMASDVKLKEFTTTAYTAPVTPATNNTTTPTVFGNLASVFVLGFIGLLLSLLILI